MNENIKIGVIGLGYVGIPVAVEFSRIVKTFGFDINSEKVNLLKSGKDPTGFYSAQDLSKAVFTDSINDLASCNVFIITVPTPINQDKKPDLSALENASSSVGRLLKKGDVVVYESTVYPGVTEGICIPLLEKYSNLQSEKDFFVGYSPERINPGDKEHTFTKIAKVVAGQSPETTDKIAAIYGRVLKAPIFRASSIKVAEAAKVIENTQRDLNIAFMNELAIIFDKLKIPTKEVLEAAGTKWNFLKFTPGLVGGHCIGVDPYYLTAKAQRVGYYPEVILAGRRINDFMGVYTAQKVIKLLTQQGLTSNNAKISILGASFKENISDTRNSRVPDIVTELREFGFQVNVADPLADIDHLPKTVKEVFLPLKEISLSEAVILAVPHTVLCDFVNKNLEKILKEKGVFADVKGVFFHQQEKFVNYRYWSL
ncbi:MAG: nucleotide sugar dehydrogenase [Candidatus Dadabacteria bacterium]|nr:MAG: nucleotide sugar dehydrogenase [Candidatus Dadabacteria bacterium]